uniref:Uncharacterized protein n=1 Tax=Oryza brachyantha TaxID=4533 RepID=J3MKA2_ORYBR
MMNKQGISRRHLMKKVKNESSYEKDSEPAGIADEGERHHRIVDVMDREDSDNEKVHDDESTDEKGGNPGYYINARRVKVDGDASSL